MCASPLTEELDNQGDSHMPNLPTLRVLLLPVPSFPIKNASAESLEWTIQEVPAVLEERVAIVAAVVEADTAATEARGVTVPAMAVAETDIETHQGR